MVLYMYVCCYVFLFFSFLLLDVVVDKAIYVYYA